MPKLSSRSGRATNRDKTKDGRCGKRRIKKVRHWERKWVTIEDTNMKVLRWVRVPFVIEKKKEEPKQKQENLEVDSDASEVLKPKAISNLMSEENTDSNDSNNMTNMETIKEEDDKNIVKEEMKPVPDEAFNVNVDNSGN